MDNETTKWADEINALTADHFRDDAFIGSNKKLKCGGTSKPCGNACIPKKHKCRANWNKPVKAAAAAGALTAVAVGATALFHRRASARNAARAVVSPLTEVGFGVGNVARGNFAGAAKNALNFSITGKDFGKNAKNLAREYGTDIRAGKNRLKSAWFKYKNHRGAKGGRVPGLNYDSSVAGEVRDDACWKGYAQKGTKMKRGRRVPNCVPAGTKKKADGAGCGKKRSVWADGYKPDQKMLSIDSSCSRN